MVITTRNCVECLHETSGKTRIYMRYFFWTVTSSLQLWHHKWCMLVLLHEKCLSKIYWNGSNQKNFPSGKKYFTNKNNTVLSENMLDKINKKRRNNFQISKGKIQIFQKFSLRTFWRFPTDPQKILSD